MVESTMGNSSAKHMCVGLLAHVDAGKTTLSESILHHAGVIDRIGRVDKGDTYLDTDEIERQRGITVFSKQAVFRWEDLSITLLDTPGHADLSAESRRALDVLDCGILIVSASDGVNAHTGYFRELLLERNIPTFIFVNKMDQPGADRDALMKELKETFGSGAVDLSHGYTDETAETAAAEDEAALEFLLDKGYLRTEDYRRLTGECKIFPCFFGSALREEGVETLIKYIAELAPVKSYPKSFGAYVYKIGRDKKGTRLTHMKITGGKLKTRDMLGTEKVTEIRLYSGGSYRNVEEGYAGQVVAVAGPSKTYIGQGFGIEKVSTLLSQREEGASVSYTVVFSDDTDSYTALARMGQLDEELPELSVTWNDKTSEIRAGVTGTVQMEIVKELAARRWNWDISFADRRVEYKETLAEPVIGSGHFEPLRHYAEVHLLMEPAERGRGIILDTVCPTDVLSDNYQKQILSALASEPLKGVLTGSELTDVKIVILGGRAHAKHTEGGDFRQAALRAYRQALRKGHSVLLEPTFDFRADVPEKVSGRVMSDITRMGGSCEMGEMSQGKVSLTGNVPASEVGGYENEIAGFTSGEGTIALWEGEYRLCHDQDKVIAEISYDPDKDIENTADSVFCTGGAGVNVSWKGADQRMKLRFSLDDIYGKKDGEELSEPDFSSITAKRETNRDPAELERIFLMNQPANRNTGKGRRDRRYRTSKVIRPDSGYRGKSTGFNNARGEEILIVDGYNTIFAWDELKELAAEDLGASREKLLDVLSNYGTYLGKNIMVVFDAYRRPRGTEISENRGNVTVVYTKEDETADQFIERTVLENASKKRITVATSDRLEQMAVFGQGAMRMSSRELIADIDMRNEEIRTALERMKGI